MPKEAQNAKSRTDSRKLREGQRDSNAGKKSHVSGFAGLPETAKKACSGHLLYGTHAVMAALDNPERQHYHLFLTSQAYDQLSAEKRTAGQSGRQILDNHAHTILDRQQMDHLVSRNNTGRSGDIPVHQGFVLHCRPLEPSHLEEWLFKLENKTDSVRLLILDQVTDPRNIGSMMRSAQALGAGALMVTDRHAPEESGALAKAAAGALESLCFIRVTNLARSLEKLTDAGFTLIGLETGGSRTLESFASEMRLGLVMGSEGSGMRRLTRERCDHLVAIPISDKSESLNVSVAAAIALYGTRTPK